jgi:DNA-binding beta-propeller fold protein YncE
MIKQATVAVGCLLLSSLIGTRAAQAMTDRAARSAATAPVTAYVATQYPNTVTPVRLATGRLLKPIRITGQPLDVAVTPDASTVVVAYASVNRSSVTLIHTATGKAFKTVRFTGFPWPGPVLTTRDSRTAYIANDAWSGTVIPLRTRTGRLGPPIRVGHDPVAMAITPDGKTAYVLDTGGVTPIRTATGTALRAISLGRSLFGGVAFTPDSRFIYVASGGLLIPVRTATGKRGQAIGVSEFIETFAIAR